MRRVKTMSKYSVVIVLAGIAVNLALSRAVLLLGLPLYLDSIGTVLAAMLGGYLPGIIVGFFSNAINGLSDSVTLYYGIISILIALATGLLADRGKLSAPRHIIPAAGLLTLIGGGLGSLLTWLLFGFGIGTGITAPYAIALRDSFGIPDFLAQLTADLAVDFIDKIITVTLCFIIVKLIPDTFLEKFSPNYPPGRKDSEYARRSMRHSLSHKVILIIATISVILGSMGTVISYILYCDTMNDRYINTATSVVDMEVEAIDGDAVDGYFKTGVTPEYLEVKESLQRLRDCVPDILYVYVYQIRQDGCYVVFDTDSPDLQGETLGAVVPIEQSFLPYKETLLAGGEIPPIVSNGAYGWLMTVYSPVTDSTGRCVAYAAADIPMGEVMASRSTFVIKMVSLMFGAAIIIISFAVWFAEKYLITPINSMAHAAGKFAYDTERERLSTTRNLQMLDIHTGDEIENLYIALKKTVTDVSDYIADIKDKADTIAQMQKNIIFSFADMVENRDLSTGMHIKHTAEYVRIISEQLLRDGTYPETVNGEYVDAVVRSAPLHDLGKIQVPDTILNKPGRLAPDEFEIIKKHSAAGREIIRGVNHNVKSNTFFAEGENMAAYHHERWDGSGYPEGLSGAQIPLSARIMAVADVYDALISRRSYKEPFPADEAVALISEESGTHFDPVVVEAFLRARAEIDEVTRNNE